jgi:YfiH family protein
MANWAAPPNIHALTTTRHHGVTQAPYDQNNLALHVGDCSTLVNQNRAELAKSLQLTHQPIWLLQTHSNLCVVAEEDNNRMADAMITRQKNLPLSIMTADCLPIVLCNQSGTEIAAIHAGWKGLANGIIENTITTMQSPSNTLIAWIGPAICQSCYQTGQNVQDIYVQRYPYTRATFKGDGKHCYTNLPKIAELILNTQGIDAVYQSNVCTFERYNDFYSYRRESQTGRMATLIWIKEP